MYGADGKTPELRPASIKGVMRFWWRAINGDLSLKDLKEKEDEIFGNTEKKSSFSINPIKIISESDFEISPTPHHKVGYCNKNNSNCFYRNDQCMKAKKKKAKIYKFNIKMSIRNNEYLNKDGLEKLFKITTLLGGFGQRSRRGFGSIRIKGDNTLISIEEIEKLIKSINPKFEYNHRNKSKNEQYPYIKNIKIDNNLSEKNYFILVEKIGKTSHKYCENMFGSGQPRYASPLYISILKANNDYIPIFTTLHNTKYMDNDKLEKFKRLSYE